ncbi:hypothetical protein C8R44DRAFT_731531 [Mycena epipterygia]|nr:hypothetical protein C8R44DRAFT_731531 [Mycena epipterygia]
MDNIEKFTDTLHKIHTFIEAQQDGSKIKHFFRQGAMNTLRQECHTGLQQAVEVEAGLTIFADIASIQRRTNNMHKELLELIGSLSDGTTSDGSSSIYQTTGVPYNSSNSLSMLPSKPKIFHGRELELQAIVDKLIYEPARIAILGTGGMGKTSLARAALHHPDVAAKYEEIFFVACDSVLTSIELAALIGSHLGLKPGKNLTKLVVEHFARGSSCLLILDNLETIWEPLQSCCEVEEFLALLTAVSHLALIVTMRDAERPGKVRWTRPFLEPLKPLSDDAARQTFVEIADDFHDSKEIDKLLHLTDNMPLAVYLIAHLADYEGCSNVLACWETAKTSLLSTGYDKQSSLDASIMMSLTSPRMTTGAKDLLSLLSILPDGLSDVELLQSDLPIQDLLGCRATLLQTSLAYFDDKKRLKLLVPIREHVHHFSPPSFQLFHPLSKYFKSLLDLYQKDQGLHENNTRIKQIVSNHGNLQRLLLLELHLDNPDLRDAINCTISLSAFDRLTGYCGIILMDRVSAVLPQLCDHYVEIKFITELLNPVILYSGIDREHLIHKGMLHLHNIDDPVFESEFYRVVGSYYHYVKKDPTTSRTFFVKALSLAKACGSKIQELNVLHSIALLKYAIGQFPAALMHARQRTRELLHLCGLEGSTSDCMAMACMAEIHALKSEYEEAHNIYHQLLQIFSARGNSYYAAESLFSIAAVNVMRGGDLLVVRKNLDNAKVTFSALGVPGGALRCEVILTDLDLSDGNTLAAKKIFLQCLEATWGKDRVVASFCLERLADAHRWTSTNIKWPYTWTVIYLVQSQKTQEKLALYKALRCMGDVFLSAGDEDTAHSFFIVALEGFTDRDVHRNRADCMLRLGDIEKHGGNLLKAKGLWNMARPLFERSSQAKDIAQIDTRLASIDQDILDTQQKTSAHLSKFNMPKMSLDKLPMLVDIRLDQEGDEEGATRCTSGFLSL